jgi:Protein of unknown function (DUF2380)
LRPRVLWSFHGSRMMRVFAIAALTSLACVALIASLSRPSQADPLRAALFRFELDDTSLQGEKGGSRPDEQARLRRLDDQLRTLLARSGEYTPIDISAVEPEANGRKLRTCDGCEAGMAAKAGAQVSVIGWVQKVSNLILNINAVIRDAATGKVLRAGSVDIRGNTDEAWSRGLSYLVANRLLAAPAQ